MGMYTEIDFHAKLSKDTPDDVIRMLYVMLTDNDVEDPLIDHPFFQCTRWRMIGHGTSAYFDADSHAYIHKHDWASDGSLAVGVRCNLKNYESEIEKFLAWIGPHVDAYENEMLGYVRYEEADLPDIILYRSGGLVTVAVEEKKL